MRIIKFGRKSDPSLREVALGLVKQAAERSGMTLGEVKALLFVTTLEKEVAHYSFGTVEEGAMRVEGWRRQMGMVASAPDYKWGGGARQFEPILIKAIEYYEQVVIPTRFYG